MENQRIEEGNKGRGRDKWQKRERVAEKEGGLKPRKISQSVLSPPRQTHSEMFEDHE